VFNAITDVAGVEVGYATVVRGKGKLVLGRGPVRTGVTAILPRGKQDGSPLFAAWFSQNGNGEMTGTTFIEETGVLTSPILLTNTHSVGVVRDAVVEWQFRNGSMSQPWSLPVVAETYDGFLNDINGFHITPKHVWKALDHSHCGAISEGNVGGGTGMIGYGWKGGTGTASRKLRSTHGGYTLGVLVQLNCGRAHELIIAGVPFGLEVTPKSLVRTGDLGSIIIVAATDAPLLPHQLKRVARRLTMGLARTGSVSGNGSGDIFLTFSTAKLPKLAMSRVHSVRMLPDSAIDPIFTAAVQATEEAIINALVAGRTMTGIDERTVQAIPHEKVRTMMERYRRSVVAIIGPADRIQRTR
jgi:L-aminopeptidase/D-esterase-like protein